MLKNKSFEDTWIDKPVLNTINQEPNYWNLSYVAIGTKLRSANAYIDVDHIPKLDTARTIPECVHKGLFTVWNLPENERPGGSDPLILDGLRVYKIFSNYGAYGAQLLQTVFLEPGSKYKVTWNVRVHANPLPGGDASPGAGVWRVGLNDTFTEWKTFEYGFKDRVWERASIEITVPMDGKVDVIGQFESRSEAGIDFFVDAVADDVTEIVQAGDPRVPYDRSYVLLPGKDKATQEEISKALQELMPLFYQNQFTVGFSADDAGIGKLPVKKVIVVFIHETDWNKLDLVNFFDKYYPGTQVEFISLERKVSFPVGTETYPPKYWYCAQYFSSDVHPGIDINLDIAPWGDVERGYPIYAVLDGEVHYVTDAWSGCGMGVIKHTLDKTDYWVQYAHVDFTVNVGDKVKAGQVIGTIADYTPGAGGDHLHFAVSTSPFTREFTANKAFIDPIPWLKSFLSPEIVDAMLERGDHLNPKPPIPTYTLRSNTLIGLHSGFEKAGWDTYLTQTKATLQKVFSAGFAVNAKNIAPDALVIFRKHVVPGIKDPIKAHAKEYVDLYALDIELTARDRGLSVDEVLSKIDIVESLNEEVPTFNLPQLHRAVEFDYWFAEYLYEKYGNKVGPGLLTVAVGNPHETEVEYLLPAVEQAVKYNGALAYHAYWAANETESFLIKNWKQHAGRWSEWDKVFTANNLYPRYYFGESGRCYAHDGWSFNPAGGWKLCGSIEKYLDDLETFNTLLLNWNKDHGNRAYGATIFGYGNWGWDSFELGEGDLLLLKERFT